MTRPEIIRADSVDLQDRDAPSAINHTHPRTDATQPASFSAHRSPHQAETLREVAADTAEERRISWSSANLTDFDRYGPDFAADIANSLNLSPSAFEPQVSGLPSDQHVMAEQQQQRQQQDVLAIAQNGGVESAEEDMDDVDDDEDLDDDMMEKISSSPSIEDGWSPRHSASTSSLRLRPSPGSCASTADSGATVPIPAGGSPPAVHCMDSSVGLDSTPDSTSVRPKSWTLEKQGHVPKREPLAPLSGNTSPFQVHWRAQNSKSSAVSPNYSRYHHHRHFRDENDHIGFKRHRQYMTSHALAPKPLDIVSVTRPLDESGQNEDGDAECSLRHDTNMVDSLTVGFEGLLLSCGDVDGSGDSNDSDESEFNAVLDDDDDMLEGFPEYGSQFLDSGWGSDCLHSAEDIDFEFVYALHTFMATVEGQANATKGDTMVLLDDSNSYWWLVRVVKDSSIGYLPAEHIETPTERLARLNKHRNIDLSATMLGDQAEKSKNPLKSAMRRRKGKTVTFAAPTYVDYSDIDYSTDDEDLEAEYFAQQQQGKQQEDDHKKNGPQDAEQEKEDIAPVEHKVATRIATQEIESEDEMAKVEPLKARTPKENGRAAEAEKAEVQVADVKVAKKEEVIDDSANGKAVPRTSEEVFVASKSETPGPKRTRDGTLRDSFLKDDTVETKKITLTPYMLRDESAPRTSSESKEARQRPSLDRVDRDFESILAKDDKKKKDKKEKDKKAGGFRSLFSRKDKKRADVDDDESIGKRSVDISSETTDRDRMSEDTEDSLYPEKASPPPATSPQRQSSKLQKQQPLTAIAELSPTKATADDLAAMRMVRPDDELDKKASPKPAALALSSEASNESSRPQMVAKASSRAVLDEFDTDEGGTSGPQRQTATTQPSSQTGNKKAGSLAVRTERSTERTAEHVERLSESPVRISPLHSNNPPALVVDTSSQEDQSSPISSPSPELVGSDGQPGNHRAQDSVTTSTSTTTASTATWNDASLRAFFDSGTDIRDLLVVVYDKSNVVPAGPDHPVVGTLFKEQNAKLAEITTQLDNMLGDWLARKQRSRNTL